MADKSKEDDIKVEIEGTDDGQQVVVVEKAGEQEADKGPTVDDAIAKLTRERDEERSKRVSAERKVQEAERHIAKADEVVQDSNLTVINTGINVLKNEKEQLKRDYSNALAAGKFDEVAEINTRMSENAAKLLNLENGKAALEHKHKTQPRSIDDPVEKLASSLSPRSAEWVRNHPEYATNDRMFSKMINAHNIVVADGIAPDTDDYFREVEAILKISKPQPKAEMREETDESALSEASRTTRRREAPPVAPVLRENSAKNRPGVVKLTKDEIEMAQMMGQTPQEYAKNKLKLIEEGKMSSRGA